MNALSPFEDADSISIDYLAFSLTYLKAEFDLYSLRPLGVASVAVAILELKPSLLMSSMSPVMLFFTIDVIRSTPLD